MTTPDPSGRFTRSGSPAPAGDDALPPKPASASRMSLAILTEPGHANAFGTVHGGVILRLADECGGIVALRHAGSAQVATAAIDSLVFLGPVHPGERVEITAEVTYVGRTSIEAHIVVVAEPLHGHERRTVGVGYGLYVALDAGGRPVRVPPLPLLTEADRARDAAARDRQASRLARRDAARGESGGG